ncbi:hypothetical protein GCM10011512_28350 [Tersicoccus solisilvae]|uniref:O-antigen ligase n=1 Tax=Tersicoccus solisilvae TaxID=1882339 RepID=A0ABQ1PMS9_9MICC|nr:hypothetical protein [Tersicoccus solisilvae]GGC99777.1 hypothetical protein GCM10011512_28350 [Tersicoccus solisilvae]
MTSTAPERSPVAPVPLRPERRLAWVGQVAAAVACVAVGGRFPFMAGLTVPLLLAVLLAPAWIPAVRRFRTGTLIWVSGLVVVASGVVTTQLMSADHRVDERLLWNNSLLLVGLVTGVGMLVWSRTVIGDRATCLWYAVGLVLSIGFRGVDPDNPWKFTFSVPTVVLVLALTAYLRGRVVQLIALALLAVVSALNDSRSAASIILIAATLVSWQMLQRMLRVRSTTTRTLALFLVVAITGYFAMQAFILEGFLGEASQARSQAQIERSGSVLTGGRPEIGASIALLERSPWGYGSGTLVNSGDLQAAKAGMHSLNYDPNNGYVERYMFGAGYEVHSLLGDFWTRFGILGAVFIVVLAVVVLVGAAKLVAEHRANPLVLYLALQAVWDTLFSPFFFTSIAVMMIAVAMTLHRRSDRRAATHPADTPATAPPSADLTR